MKNRITAIILPVFAVLLGCRSTLHTDQQKSWRNRDARRQAADERARLNGDMRPYPEGWPENMLPRTGDAQTAELIALGMTMTQVKESMGQAHSWPGELPRFKFVLTLRACYKEHEYSYADPKSNCDCERHF